jgi:predicted transcriptional regulator of viral defense system
MDAALSAGAAGENVPFLRYILTTTDVMERPSGMSEPAERLLDRARSRGLIRTCDLLSLGIARVLLTRAVRRGDLERVGRGLYGLPGREISMQGSLAEVALRVPRGVVCLLSALRFHDLTTQAPFEVWLAIENKSIAPKLDYPPLRIVRFSGAAFTEGVEEHIVDGVTVRVTGVAKTVADCFKFRNKIGLDVALEALRDAWQGRRVTSDEIWRYAKICRVANVMRPYLESLG